MKFVINRRRSGPVRSSTDWKVVLQIDEYAVQAETEVPSEIVAHWQVGKSPLGYAPIKGLSTSQMEKLQALSKGRKLRLGLNRMGDVHAYKLLEGMPNRGLPPLFGFPWEREE